MDKVQASGCRSTAAANAGFTLIELMIVLVIIAVLAAIALPSYTRYVTRTNRVAAAACLGQYAGYMERFYSTNLSYSKDMAGTAFSLPALDCASQSNTGGSYNYTIVTSPSTYTVTATPKGTQLARDTQCGALSLDQKGTQSPQIQSCWR